MSSTASTYPVPFAWSVRHPGKIVNKLFVENMAYHRYCPVKFILGQWGNNKNMVNFDLVVDKFGVKYTNKDNILHLNHILKNE